VVAVERRISLVVDDAPRVEVRLTGVVAFLESGDTAFDGLDSTPNSFLDEVGVM
jgi:hypothetical protein